jgi:F0F1-type ATP synthase gamma subunit
MRSAYDTACEYSAQLETEINRKRQSQVTADVLEIASDYSKKGEV